MTETGNFGYLGYNFQVKLINLIISDKSFAQSILDVVESKYFDNQYFKLIVQIIKGRNQ